MSSTDMDTKDALYVGFEISTQQLKVIAVDDSLNVVYEDAVKFESDLPEFQTVGGVNMHADQVTFTASPLMWTKAFDMVLARMKIANFNFGKVRGVSGAGQQHGSVYWKHGARKHLASLDPHKSLHEQLENSFSIMESPIWMDASTDSQCKRIEEKIGGPLRLTEITGCRAYHRITGNQIAKIHETQLAGYNDTERISLVSSFGASIFLTDYACIDESDGSGMNLMDIRSRDWSNECLQAYGVPNLREKLGNIVRSSQSLGNISRYMIERYAFSPDCKVIAFTGDNPASMAGMRPNHGDVVVSLGTSDTILLWLDEPRTAMEGLVLVNPLDTKAYMGMLCFKNGSLTREKVIKASLSSADCNMESEHSSSLTDSWAKFDELLASSSPGNGGNIGIYFTVPEITPNAVGVYRFNASDHLVSSFDASVEVRALIEGQFLAKRVHAENLGYKLGVRGRVLATGGASSNLTILQVLSDVFNASVYVLTVANSACLGSAYRAKHGCFAETRSFHEIVKSAPVDVKCCANPNPQNVQIYNSLVGRYRSLEQEITSDQKQ